MPATTSERLAEAPVTAADDACLVCGGTRFLAHFRGAAPLPAAGTPPQPYRITHSQRERVRAVLRCETCGLVFLPRVLVQVGAYHEGADPYYAEQAEERIANAHRLLALVPAGGRLLDVGCACGFLLVAARERGFEVQGLEASRWASEYARREYGLDVRTAALEDVDGPTASYDVAVLADVIEHFTDPRAAVRRLHTLLSQGGRLLILTPDIGSVVARIAGARWWGLLDDHYFYFSRATLRRLLESEGFTVERFTALGRSFPLRHWIFKLSQYSDGLQRLAMGLARGIGADAWQISFNFLDQMACVAVKK